MKPLKILIGNNTLSLLAGTETWTYTLAVQLEKLGHLVHCFSPELGIISDKLKEKDVLSFAQISTSGVKPFSFVLEEKIDHDYDIIIANHNHIVKYLREQFPNIPIISTIHGVLHWMDGEKNEKIMAPEHPALDSGVNQFISVSEEVQETIQKEYGIDSLIVRNFFDIPGLKTKRKISEKPLSFLVNSNYNDKNSEEIDIVRRVAKHYGAQLNAVGQNYSLSENISKTLEDIDVVFGIGRSVLEGVAAGRLGIVHGRWGTGGVICEKNIEELRSCNFSGRNSEGKLSTPEEIIEMIDENYNQRNIDWGIEYMKRDHNVLTAADFYVQLARDLTGQSIVRKKDPELRPYKRQKDGAKS